MKYRRKNSNFKYISKYADTGAWFLSVLLSQNKTWSLTKSWNKLRMVMTKPQWHGKQVFHIGENILFSLGNAKFTACGGMWVIAQHLAVGYL